MNAHLQYRSSHGMEASLVEICAAQQVQAHGAAEAFWERAISCFLELANRIITLLEPANRIAALMLTEHLLIHSSPCLSSCPVRGC
ncbi:hypothetical protein MHYP_G00244370 [Metynnis hypsauchen]